MRHTRRGRSGEATTVDWLEWNNEAFARAEAEQKPILLAIGATWCHSCLEMERTSYADPAVAAIINERFVPIKVDADRRPDINERYSLGGWPTTAFLTPDGEVLGGGTYVQVQQMPAVLRQVAEAFATRREEIDRRAGLAARRREAERAASAALAGQAPDADADGWLCAHALEQFDAEHGGFGTEPKFPHVDALTLALDRYRDRPDDRLQRIVTATLDAMGWGGLYDDVEGGFFRYCAARDWTLPHFEKMLNVNAALLRAYLEASTTFEHAAYRDKAIDIIRYVHATLVDPVDGGFFASQRADERYYVLPVQQRRVTSAPAVDRSLYADANALMAMAYVRAADVLGDSSLLDFAIKSLERVVVATYERGGGIAHNADEAVRVRGLLTDQVYVSATLLDLYEATERDVYLDMAQELMHYSLRTMWDEAVGGFFDRVEAGPSEVGLLRERLKPFAANCDAARVLARLALLTRDSRWRDRAIQTLGAQTGTYRAHGVLGAPYGLAAQAVLSG